MNLNEKVSIKFILIFFIGLVLGLLGSGFLNLSEGTLLYEGIQLQDNTEKWMTFMSILSTLLATFFIYTGFRIEAIKEALVGTRQEVKDTMEFGIQLEYCMSFIIQKQFDKAIDSLMGLKQEVFVYKIPERVSTCYFFLAHCHHEKNTYDDSILAVQYINDVYEEKQMNPFKGEIIDRFEELSKIESGVN